MRVKPASALLVQCENEEKNRMDTAVYAIFQRFSIAMAGYLGNSGILPSRQ